MDIYNLSPGKPKKQNDDDNSAESKNKENIGIGANAVSMIADLPIVIVSDDEKSQNEMHTQSPPNISSNNKLPLLFSGNYFQIISRNAAGTKAKCMAMNCEHFCTGTKATTSNFTTHLKVDKIDLCF